MKPTTYKIDSPWPGQLAIAPRPRCGDWLEDEVHAWKKPGVDLVVSLITGDEAEELELKPEAELCQAKGLQFVSLAIPDRGLPPSREAFLVLAKRIEDRLAKGSSVLLHCRAGIGRSAMLAATVLMSAGIDAQAAFDRIAASRGCPVPDTAEQRRWVIDFGDRLAKMPI